jgi:transposase-like protein
MLHRIRFAMHRGTFDKMGGGGPVEADETFIGGKARNMHKDKRDKMRRKENLGKELVMGLLDRETSKVHVTHIPGRRKAPLQAEIRKHVAPGAKVFTDELKSYEGLAGDFEHQFVNHAEQYVDGLVHTNGLENVWSLLKRSLKGTYVSVEPFHLFRYLDEQAFRYNERKHEDGDAGRFEDVIEQIAGKRLTYCQLTGKECAPIAAEGGC